MRDLFQHMIAYGACGLVLLLLLVDNPPRH